MPGLWHDSGNELFKDDPEFARRLFRLAGVDLPPDVRASSGSGPAMRRRSGCATSVRSSSW
jgi:hypothetical protein